VPNLRYGLVLQILVRDFNVTRRKARSFIAKRPLQHERQFRAAVPMIRHSRTGGNVE
jgi:hypothetical protein